MLKSLTVVTENDIDITFVGDDGTTVTHRFTFKPSGLGEGSVILNGDAEFLRLYRRVPGPSAPMWPEKLAFLARSTLLSLSLRAMRLFGLRLRSGQSLGTDGSNHMQARVQQQSTATDSTGYDHRRPGLTP